MAITVISRYFRIKISNSNFTPEFAIKILYLVQNQCDLRACINYITWRFVSVHIHHCALNPSTSIVRSTKSAAAPRIALFLVRKCSLHPVSLLRLYSRAIACTLLFFTRDARLCYSGEFNEYFDAICESFLLFLSRVEIYEFTFGEWRNIGTCKFLHWIRDRDTVISGEEVHLQIANRA